MAHPKPTPGPIVIIGAGQAGFSAADKLRDLGHAGPITLIGAEAQPPYQRPPLSKAYLLGALGRERLFLRPAEHFARREIDLRLGVRATAIRPGARAVVLSDGTSVPYDRLLLATGAMPRRLPEGIGGTLAGVMTMRNLADADGFAAAIRAARRLLVVGGGYVGLEAAASARKLGVAVTLIEAADRILKRVAAPETADYFRKLHQDHGVDLREGVALSRLEGQGGRVTSAVLGDGQRLEADLVLVGIGVEPETGLAEAAGIATDGGIVVDAFCETSHAGIYAAGDCAAFPWQGERLRLESVGNSIDQAEVAAANMLGHAVTYQARPWFWSDQYDTKLQIAGLSRRFDQVVVRAGASDQARSIWYFAAGKLQAVDAINEPRVFMIAKRLLEGGLPVDPAGVAKPGTDLRALLADQGEKAPAHNTD